MTPDDLARLKALAEAARDASDAYAHICATAPTWTDEASRLSDAEDDALEDLHEVATPAAILALIEAATPVPAGAGICADDLDECTVTLALDSEEQVRELRRALPPKHRVRLMPDRSELHWARLLAERDAAREALIAAQGAAP